MSTDLIGGLGRRVAREWRAANHDERRFPAIAAEALADSGVLTEMGVDALVAWSLGPDVEPTQAQNGFGQPRVVLYRSHEFHVEALFWFDETTAVHQHSFSGAFGLLAGSSVHATYDFHVDDRVSARLLLGELVLRDCEVLEQGDVRPIVAGPAFIHAQFHLDRPSVSIVVRTGSDPDQNPQYSYLPPSVAVDPFYEPEPMTTQLLVLDAEAQAGPDRFVAGARRLLVDSDLWLAFKVLERAFAALPAERYDALEDECGERLGPRARRFRGVFEERRRQRNIVARRGEVDSADHRFLLALLLHAPSPAVIRRLVRQRRPGVDPDDQIVTWLGELSARGAIGLDFDPVSLTVLRAALKGADLAQVEAAMRRAFPVEQVDAQAPNLHLLWDEIQSSVLLQPLFA